MPVAEPEVPEAILSFTSLLPGATCSIELSALAWCPGSMHITLPFSTPALSSSRLPAPCGLADGLTATAGSFEPFGAGVPVSLFVPAGSFVSARSVVSAIIMALPASLSLSVPSVPGMGSEVCTLPAGSSGCTPPVPSGAGLPVRPQPADVAAMNIIVASRHKARILHVCAILSLPQLNISYIITDFYHPYYTASFIASIIAFFIAL
jgi:hypothetical protein